MKVAFLVSRWPVDGGIETVTRTLANEMVCRGHQVNVIYSEYFNPSSSGAFVDDRIVESFIPDVSGCSKDEMIKRASEFLKILYKREGFDVIINQCYPTWTSEVFKDIKGYVKIIECYHMIMYGPSRYKRLKWKGWDLKMRLCGPWIFRKVEKVHISEAFEREFQNVDKFVLLAESFVEEYTKIRGDKFSQGKLTYMHNPLAQNVTLTDKEFLSKDNIVLCVSRMTEDVKRISYMIETWVKIEKDNRFEDWKFDIVGDGPSLMLYKDMARNLGLKRITFWGYQNPEKFYKRSKILLMTSVSEGWGMAIPEAQQCGVVPIVLNTFSSVHELIVDEYNGRIVNYKLNFLHCLKETMIHYEKWETMARNGIETCKQFRVSHIVDEWEKLIDSINRQ